MLDARALITDLRHGRAPSPAALHAFAAGLADGRVSDAQAGAFAMAVCLNGLGAGGAVALTLGMRDSGDVMDWDLPGPVVDKHSTGGLGDCTSLVLSPILAACGVFNPMISGRGLGHTGGTLDKLESIPGLNTNIDQGRFCAIVRAQGCAIVAASADLAPADKRLYAVRDTTGTVESIDLITASILSKKLAAGLGALVLDVKVGSGAFMATLPEAQALAQSLVETANGAGCPTAALITDMNQPLAASAGNAVEMAEVMAVLEGAQMDSPLEVVTIELAAAVLHLCGVVDSPEAGRLKASTALSDGTAAERFAAMIADLGAPSDFIATWRTLLPQAPVQRDLPAPATGHVAAIDGRALGLAVVRLGGGRQVETDRIDPAVGLSHILPLGTSVAKGDPLLRIHAATGDMADAAAETLHRAITIGPAPELPPLIHEEIT